VSGHLCIKCSCDLVGRCDDLVRVASWRRQGLGRAGNTFAAGGGPRARQKSSGVGCPCPRLGSGEARSSPSNRLIPDLIAPIRPLQLYADGGYQLRIRSLKGTPNYGPRQGYLNMDFFIRHNVVLFVVMGKKGKWGCEVCVQTILNGTIPWYISGWSNCRHSWNMWNLAWLC
jgi:hypothetical protein